MEWCSFPGQTDFLTCNHVASPFVEDCDYVITFTHLLITGQYLLNIFQSTAFLPFHTKVPTHSLHTDIWLFKNLRSLKETPQDA